jgi:hypothetical protein
VEWLPRQFLGFFIFVPSQAVFCYKTRLSAKSLESWQETGEEIQTGAL